MGHGGLLRWAPSGTTQPSPVVCEGDKLLPWGTGSWRGGSPKPGTWWAVGTSQVGTLCGRPPPQPGHLSEPSPQESQDTGSRSLTPVRLSPLRTVVWVREGGRRLREGAQVHCSSETRK